MCKLARIAATIPNDKFAAFVHLDMVPLSPFVRLQKLLTWCDMDLEITFHLRGYPDEAAAMAANQRVREVMWELASELGLTLAGIDGVIIAYDYDSALAELDRGFTASRPLNRTSDEFAIGVAMCPLVKRDGKVLSHLVLSAALGLHRRELETCRLLFGIKGRAQVSCPMCEEVPNDSRTEPRTSIHERVRMRNHERSWVDYHGENRSGRISLAAFFRKWTEH